MNLKELKEMIALMNDNHLTELELEREGLKIRLKRGHDQSVSPNVVIERMPAGNAGFSHAQSIQSESSMPQAEAANNKNLQEIKAPMVGTFYRAPSPDAADFVEVGSTVEIGQVICIIEAMKLMNEIKSEVKGKVVEILVENADPIEFGQILFKIETA